MEWRAANGATAGAYTSCTYQVRPHLFRKRSSDASEAYARQTDSRSMKQKKPILFCRVRRIGPYVATYGNGATEFFT